MEYVLMAYATMSVITFISYGLDKRAAKRSAWRTPEFMLHAMALMGGFPGALLGQKVFRHKTSKRDYLLILWAIVALHAAAWVAWLLYD